MCPALLLYVRCEGSSCEVGLSYREFALVKVSASSVHETPDGSYLEAVYLRGLAYLRLRKGTEAVAEFRKIVDHKGASWGATWVHPYWGQYYSLSYLGMARGFEYAGDMAKAREAFQDFFELWRDADPEIPILRQAKAEYAALQ
jgi:eukaryotic-like serine/threonine-protein kinase